MEISNYAQGNRSAQMLGTEAASALHSVAEAASTMCRYGRGSDLALLYLFELVASDSADRTGLGWLIAFMDVIADKTSPFFHHALLHQFI